ncbi:putative membrane protein [Peptoniphilus sp. ING2-D1G]|nr:putative membrane protein [Peptoniphilus sp. ING2-D1G]
MKNLYLNLATKGITKNKEVYLPFIILNSVFVMMYGLCLNILLNKSIDGYEAMQHVKTLLYLGILVLSIFSLIFLVYANNFIMKRRRSEFGLYNILGLEKTQISKILVVEFLIAGLGSILTGLIFSSLFYRLFEDLFLKAMKLQTAEKFIPDFQSYIITFGVFFAIDILIVIFRIIEVKKTNVLDLFTKSKKREKNIIPLWTKALLSVLFIGTGYYMSLSSRSPLDSLSKFFVATFLVIIGTYFGFNAITSVVLDILKKKEDFYYRTNNFVAISGLKHRIRQNAAGLAGICVMSCATLVLISSAVSLYFTADRMIKDIFPGQINIKTDNKFADKNEIYGEINELLAENKAEPIKEFKENFSRSAVKIEKGKVYNFSDYSNWFDYTKSILVFMNKSALGDEYKNNDDKEAFYYSNNFPINEINLPDDKILISKRIKDFKFKSAINEVSVLNTVLVFVDDLESLTNKYPELLSDESIYSFDIKGDQSNEKADKISSAIERINGENTQGFKLTNRENMKIFFMSIYGAIFFIGIFLGAVFILATALSIYYKQISEGYEDIYRFGVYRKAGMTEKEVKQSINTQVKTVFLLPPIVAGIHIAVAFKVISFMLSMIGLFEIRYKIISFAVVYAIYFLSYILIYKLTSRSYYAIVSKEQRAL